MEKLKNLKSTRLNQKLEECKNCIKVSLLVSRQILQVIFSVENEILSNSVTILIEAKLICTETRNFSHLHKFNTILCNFLDKITQK